MPYPLINIEFFSIRLHCSEFVAGRGQGVKVFSEGHKNYFKDLCLMNSQPTFLFLTYLKVMHYGNIIKSM